MYKYIILKCNVNMDYFMQSNHFIPTSLKIPKSPENTNTINVWSNELLAALNDIYENVTKPPTIYSRHLSRYAVMYTIDNFSILIMFHENETQPNEFVINAYQMIKACKLDLDTTIPFWVKWNCSNKYSIVHGNNIDVDIIARAIKDYYTSVKNMQ